MKIKKHIILCLIFALNVQLSTGQDQVKIDSLINVLKNEHNDTSRAKINNALSQLMWETSDYDKAAKYANEALVISMKNNFTKGQAKAYNNLGVIAMEQGIYAEAVKNYNLSIKVCKEINDQQGISIGYSNLGIVLFNKGDYKEALKNYLIALKISEQEKDTAGVTFINNTIAIIYEKQNDFTEALKYEHENLAIAKRAQDQKLLAVTYNALGRIYKNQGKYAEALIYSREAIKIYELNGRKRGLAIAYNNIGNIYMEQDKNEEALTNFFITLKIDQEIGDLEGVAIAYYNIASIYYNVGNYKSASSYYNQGLSVSNKIGYVEIIQNTFLALARVDSALGNFKHAFANYKSFSQFKDSIFNVDNTNQLNEMKTKYESDRKDDKIALLNKDNLLISTEVKNQKIQKFAFIGGLTFIIILLSFGYRAYRSKQAFQLQEIRNKIAGDLHDDIGSTLNSISIYSEVARKKGDMHDEALEMIGDSSRKIIDAMSDIVWAINPDNDGFEKIIFRMKSLAYNLFRAKKIEFTFQADEVLNQKKLTMEERRSFYLIFKEAINNIVKYADATFVTIRLTDESGFIRLNIMDNGVGFDNMVATSGNGLKNMKRRANQMKAECIVQSTVGKGTQIELILKA
jgi:two-component system sensor histidine kinase UhpB